MSYSLNRTGAVDFLIIFANQIGSALCGLIAVVIFSGLLSPSYYGEYSLGLMVVLAFNSSVLLPVSAIAVRCFSVKMLGYEQIKSIKIAILKYLKLSAIFFLFCSCLGALFFPANYIQTGLFLSIVLFGMTQAANSFINYIVNARQKRSLLLLFDTGGSLLRIACATSLLIYIEASSTSLFAGLFIGGLLIMGPQILFLRSYFKSIDRNTESTSLVNANQVFAYGLPFAIVGLLTNSQQIAERLSLQLAFSSHELGVFFLNYQLSTMPINFLIVAVEQYLTPKILSSIQVEVENPSILVKYFSRISLLLILVSCIFAGLLFIFFNFLAPLVIEQEYILSANLPTVLALAAGIRGAALILSMKHSACLQPQRLFPPMFISSIVGVLMTVYLTRVAGLTGVCLASLLSATIYIALMYQSVAKK